ncbi:hypothetical protein LRR18_18710, partial [Mangrovimonas sp. AS39]|uniref:hypothetical protein n=1 Tax=Mangrovimonas futianensis TaxID=2895523 RepID=UPI001E38AAF9
NAAYTIIHKLGLRVAGIAYILPLGEYFGYPLTDDRIRILSIDIVQHYCKVPGLVVYFLHRLCKKAVIVHSPDPIENIIHDVRIIKTKKQYGG